MDQSSLPTAIAEATSEWQLKELSPRHKNAMSLLAQGLDRQRIGEAIGYSAEYITWLARQPLCKAYLKEMSEYADARLIALTDSSVDAIAETLRLGSGDERLKAARLQMEAIGRIGRGRPEESRTPEGGLEALAGRLIGLLAKARNPEGVEDAQVIEEVSR